MPDIDAIAERHGLSPGAVRALAEALERGRGGGAQWNHPDLGGMGQSLGGGMLQIGAMFDDGLKGRVAGALRELAASGGQPTERGATSDAKRAWWPEELGTPTATGAQNAMRYACFPAERRLVIDDNDRVTVYDTGSYRLTGFAQSQGGSAQDLRFSGPDGDVEVRDLTQAR